MYRANRISIICLSMIAVTLLAISIFISHNKNSSNLYLNVANSAYSEDSEAEAEYIVKEYNQQVAVFKKGNNEPYQILDIDIMSLPLADREALKQGISFKDTRKLSQLIEDYDG